MSFVHDVSLFKLFYAFMPPLMAEMFWSRRSGFIPSRGRMLSFLCLSSTWRGTFPLRFVAAHMLQHGAGNVWARLRARKRAGNGLGSFVT